MEPPIPSYLNETFFKTALEDGLRETEIAIRNFHFAPSDGGGENYCSSIYRVKVRFARGDSDKSEDISLIVKSMPTRPEMGVLEDMQVYLKEKIFYYDVMPRMEVLLDAGVRFGAKCLYATKDPMKTIVFEDLTTYEYKLASRQKGLDEKHCRVLLKKLGQFHAASMILAKKDPDIMKRYNLGMLSVDAIKKPDGFIKFLRRNVDTLAGIVGKWPGYEEISRKLFEYGDNLANNLRIVGRIDETGFKVLNHGDLWVNNFMFKYESEEPVDVLFVDFQCSCYTSPGCDLNFFLNSSVQLDVLMTKREVLIDIYYESLKTELESVNWPQIPYLADIRREVDNRESFGLFAAYQFLPMVAMEKKDSADHSMEAMQDEEYARKKVLVMFNSGERTLSTLKYSLKRFDELGVLDNV